MPLDLAALWDFSDPAASERRFLDLLAGAHGDDAVILRTQIARTHGLRRDFLRAREILSLCPAAPGEAGPEARVRVVLETGRTFASAAHRPGEVTPEAREQAAALFRQAATLARAHGLDALAVDALHMIAVIAADPEARRAGGCEALAVALGSDQPDARRWEASLRHNLGLALHDLGRLDEALAEFTTCVALREAAGNADAVHVAHWMVAWTLRGLGRVDEALALQQSLERAGDQRGTPDPFVFEELEHLHRARGELDRAEAYARRRVSASPATN